MQGLFACRRICKCKTAGFSCTSLGHSGHTCSNDEKATTHEVDIDCDEIDDVSTSSSQSNVSVA